MAALAVPAWTYPYVPNACQCDLCKAAGRPLAGHLGPQQLAHRVAAVSDEIMYGGAAGGGKTDWGLGTVLGRAFRWPRSNHLILRREFKQLRRLGGIEFRLVDRIPRHIGVYNRGDYRLDLVNGSRIELGGLDADADVGKYQGAEYLTIWFEEATQFTEYQFRYMLSRCRVAGDLAVAGAKPRMLLTGNPGGVGHLWCRERYIDPAPPGVVWKPEGSEDEPTPGTRVFIPARVTDTPQLDVGYVNRLLQLPEDERRALAYGDWDVFTGQRFREFRRHLHVIDPEEFPLPAGGDYDRRWGADYGYEAPFAALRGVRMADGLVVITHEIYGPDRSPAQQGAAIATTEAALAAPGHQSNVVILDPSTWARNPAAPRALIAQHEASGLPPPQSIADDYRKAGLNVQRGHNDRVVGASRIADYLRPRPDPRGEGPARPRLLIYSTCVNLIRTLPALQRDKLNPECYDTHGEDHAPDALRYLLMSWPALPLSGQAPRPAMPRSALGTTITGDLGRTDW